MIRNKGFTLVELLIGVLIITLLALFCLPLGLSSYQKNQLQITENELSNAVRFARTMAMLQGSPLVLRPLPNSKDWSDGMILLVDNKNHCYRKGDKILHQWQWQHSAVRISWHGFQSDDYLLFSPELKHAASSGHFDIYVNQEKSMQLIINRFGRITKKEKS